MTRRRFLLFGAGGAAWSLALGRTWSGVECAMRGSHAFGTEVSVTALHASAEVAGRAAEAALAEIRLVDELMSLYRPDSPIRRLNREGAIDAPHRYLVEILSAATHFARQSNGAFDATVQPLWDLYAAAQRADAAPTSTDLREAVRRVDWRRVDARPERIRLLRRDTAVTLNGIAQGFAADRASDALRRHGVAAALLQSGEVSALGGKSRTDDWQVGIQHPRRPDAYLSVASLRGRCLATSGDYATAFDSGFTRHHLFDPRTGQCPTRFSSVSVAAPTATEADALSTALFVLGPERGLHLVRSRPGVDALLVFRDGRTLATAGFPAVI